MPHRPRSIVAAMFLAALFLAPPLAAEDKREPTTYPPTRKQDAVVELHGERIPDPFRWLEDDDAEDVVAWDRAQMKLLQDRLAAFPARAALKDRIAREFALGGMSSLPTFEGGRRWFTLRPKEANHAILYVTNDDGTAEPRVVLDPNTWSEDGTASLKAWAVSPNGSYVAYRRDEKGSEETTLFVRDVVTGKDLPDRITRTKFSSIVWTPDSKGFFYNRMPDPESVPEGEGQYHRRIRYHRLGTLPLDDPIVYGTGRPTIESQWIYRSSNREHVFITRGMPYRELDTFELLWDDGHGRLVPVVVGSKSRTYVDRVGDVYILNSDRDRGERDVFVAERGEDGEIGSWRETVFKYVDGVIQDTWVVGDMVLCHMKKNVISELWVQRLDEKEPRRVTLPGPGTVGSVSTKPGSTRIWLTFESFSRPLTTYSCDLAAETPALELEESLPTTLDVDGLVSMQTTYTSKDGTEIPVFLVHRKDVKLDGSAPTVLYGYGGFRVGMYPYFSRSIGLWTELGGVWVVACLRGGDEFGEDWHQAGCLANKQNVFDDFIAAADWLVKSGKASRDRLAVYGGSNGGLLVAAVVNQRPDLVRAGISGVPLTDMLRYHKFQYAKSWTKEYGDPDVAEEFGWIRPYSPYHNVPDGARFPAMMVTAGLHDGRVNAFHARKIVARWQEANRSEHPILLRVDRESGHGASSIDHYQKELLDRYAFLLMELDGSE